MSRKKTADSSTPSKSRGWWPFGRSDTAEAKDADPPRDNFRETVESVVIAFVLAFLFRTFEAEAFVIPTGSMAPTLTGRHKDLAGYRSCEKCGYSFFVGASEEVNSETGVPNTHELRGRFNEIVRDEYGKPIEIPEVIGNATCPVCRWTMDIGPDNPQHKDYYSYSGDRILVSKFDYTVQEPERWDIIVFKFPQDARTNYIKRLIGLPNEQVLIYQGDIYTRPLDPQEIARYRHLDDQHRKYVNFSAEDTAEFQRLANKFNDTSDIEGAGFKVARKRPEKIRAVMQIVHDSDYELPAGERNGWPARWGADYQTRQTEWKELEDGRRFDLNTASANTQWLYYRHYPLTYNEWRHPQPLAPGHSFSPRLITDCTAYNTGLRYPYPDKPAPPLPSEATSLGVHWVGDLMLDANVEITQQDGGSIVLQLVRAGERFQCRFDLAQGTAALLRDGKELATCDQSGVQGTGSWDFSMANADRKLVVWVNGSVLAFSDGQQQFEQGVPYQAAAGVRPQESDLLPVAIGLSNATGRAEQLRVWRDIYYLALSTRRGPEDYDFTSTQDLPSLEHGVFWRNDESTLAQALANGQDEWAKFLESPDRWDAYLRTKRVAFLLGPDEFMVLGDNTSKSQDSRLWGAGATSHVVERKLLIGKALFIYWPHLWDTPWHTSVNLGPLGEWQVPFYPNFGRMKLIR